MRHRNFFDDLASVHNFNPLFPENWYNLERDIILSTKVCLLFIILRFVVSIFYYYLIKIIKLWNSHELGNPHLFNFIYFNVSNNTLFLKRWDHLFLLVMEDLFRKRFQIAIPKLDSKPAISVLFQVCLLLFSSPLLSLALPLIFLKEKKWRYRARFNPIIAKLCILHAIKTFRERTL